MNQPEGGASVLVTGFEAFGGMGHNPSWDVASEVAARAAAGTLTAQRSQRHPGQMQVQALRLPVSYSRAGDTLSAAIDAAEYRPPDVVIALGLAAGTQTVRLERLGVNLRDARIRDNDDAQPRDEPVVPGGEGALFSTLRLKAAQQRIAAAGIPVGLSLSAGSFVCNDVLYTLLHHLRARALAASAGFVHLPDVRDPASPVSPEQAVDAVDLLIDESLRDGPDVAQPGGALH